MTGAKHPGGRPTVATPANLEKALEYITSGFLEHKEMFPTAAGMALWLGISKDSLYARPEFSDVLERLKNVQEAALIANGLRGDYNSTIAKLLLVSKHGYVEKSETDITSKGEKIDSPVGSDIVKQIVSGLKEATKDGQSKEG